MVLSASLTSARIAIGLLALVASSAFGQSTPDAAFQSGKDFAGQGMNSAGNAVNGSTGQRNLPFYNTNAPESQNYGDGRGAVGAAGSQKQIDCQGYRAGSAFDQQDCDAVNFMTRNTGDRQKFKVDKDKDPLMTGSKDVIANPGNPGGKSGQQCHVEEKLVPGKTTTETCTESAVLQDQSCEKILSIEVQQSCQPGELITSLDLPRNEVDHVKIFAKCDMNAQHQSYVEMTADSFGIRGGTVRNALVQVPKNMAEIPASKWVKTFAGKIGYELVMTHPDWEYAVRNVPVYILNDSAGCQPGTTQCSYHIYWEWVDRDWWNPTLSLHGSNEGIANSVIGISNVYDHWDNQCLYLDSRTQ